jgi:hypothetical protein
VAEETFVIAAGIVPWLQQAIVHFYPDSSYTRALDPGVRQLTAQRLFRPPRVGMRVRCPYCDAPHAAPPGTEELIQFICSHCGASVTVEPPKIQ